MSGADGNELAIDIKGLTKIFRLYDKPSDVLAELFLGRRRGREARALDGLSLAVRRGETLGLVGRNGAGKSTLLKIVSGTLVPTLGSVTVNGRIAAILELGSGFHPELSGRDNVYMGGMCMGLERREIDRRFDSIVAFSELEDHIDQPFRTYSTGMQARLSFSVATSVDPDIMIVDEALSVGDARFQLKCFSRFEEMRSQGKTVLLVSHNMTTIATMCDRAVLLEGGRIVADGEPRYIDMAYHRLLFGGIQGGNTLDAVSGGASDAGPAGSGYPGAVERFGSAAAQIVDAGLLGEDGAPRTRIRSGERCRLFMTFLVREPLDSIVAGFLIRSPRGVDLFGVDTRTDRSARIERASAGDRIRVELEVSMWLAAGEYFVTFALAQDDGLKIDVLYDHLLYRVVGTETIYTSSVANLDHRLSHRLEPRDLPDPSHLKGDA